MLAAVEAFAENRKNSIDFRNACDGKDMFYDFDDVLDALHNARTGIAYMSSRYGVF